MQGRVLFHKDDHQAVVIGRAPEKDDHVIDTNQYVIIHRGQAMLLDPGGIQIFPQVLAELAKYVRMQDIKVTFASHQAPNICSSLAMWLDMNPAIKPRMICPQHGSIFQGEHVGRLFDWLESLEVGQWNGATPKSETCAAA